MKKLAIATLIGILASCSNQEQIRPKITSPGIYADLEEQLPEGVVRDVNLLIPSPTQCAELKITINHYERDNVGMVCERSKIDTRYFSDCIKAKKLFREEFAAYLNSGCLELYK